MNSTEEIKNRLDIVDFIGNYVQLKRAGTNFKACCPFHNEKSPSFMVSKPKQLWYCFGACNEGGDIFKFLMKIEGLEFVEALKILADKAGVVLPEYDKRAESKKNILYDVMKVAVDFYVQQLHTSQGALAKNYLIKRGLSEAIIKQFGLGYAPDTWDALMLGLKDKFKDEEIATAGLALRSERSKGFYDRFRHRIMFPIYDLHSNPIGFTSRLLDEQRKEGKYVNTPETPIYNKGHVLYGLDLARQSIRQNDYAIIVEGNMDVIACHQFGQTNVVASSGTALSLDQIRLLKRYSNNIKIAFDADVAGESAAKRGIGLALQEGLQVKVIVIPPAGGKDPDECIRKDIKKWEQAVRGSREFMDYFLEKAQAKFNLNTAHGRAQFVNAILVEIVKLADLVEQDFWLKKLGTIAGVGEKLLREQMGHGEIKRLRDSATQSKVEDSKDSRNVIAPPHEERMSERLLSLFLVDSGSAKEIISTILPEMLTNEKHQQLYTKLSICYTTYDSGSSTREGLNFRQFWRNWAQKSAPDILSTADILELYGDKEFGDWEPSQIIEEARFIIKELRREHEKQRRFMLADQMRQAEERGDQDRVQELIKEFRDLSV